MARAQTPNLPEFRVVDGRFLYEKVEAIDLTKKEIVAHASAFIAERFVSTKSVVQLRDDELGKIVGDVILRDPEASAWTPFPGVKLRLMIEAKDGRYRVQASHIVGIGANGLPHAWGAIESANQYRIEPLAQQVLLAFSADLQDYLTKAKSSGGW